MSENYIVKKLIAEFQSWWISALRFKIRILYLGEYHPGKLWNCQQILDTQKVIQDQSNSNFGKARSRLKICCRGDYLSFVTLVELKPNHKFDESNPSYLNPSQILSWIPSKLLLLKVEFLLESGNKSLYLWHQSQVNIVQNIYIQLEVESNIGQLFDLLFELE